MRKNFIFKSMLMLALICMPLVMASCSDDDEEVTEVRYNMGFESLSISNITEMATIEAAYQQAIGVSSNNFTLTGSVSSCDSKVKTACKSVEKALSSQTFTGSYQFVVTNYNTQEEIYSYQIN